MIVKLKKCPKCYSEAYEHMENKSLCHACNYDSVEGYVYGRAHDARAYRRMLLKKEGLPLDERDRRRFAQGMASRYLYSYEDQQIARQAILDLPPFDRTLIYFRFWLGYSTDRISELVYLPEWEVNSLLLKTYSRLKDTLLEHPNFSGNRIRQKIEEILTPQAA